MKNYKDKRLLEMLDYLDPKFVRETSKYYKNLPKKEGVVGKANPKKQIKYIAALAACVILLSAFIPVIHHIIRNYLNVAGYTETTADETTLSPDITSEDITTSPAPEPTSPETTVPEPDNSEEETTEPLYDGTTASPEPEYDGSRGLVYKLAEDGKSAWLFGMGTCTDADITVASAYNGVPVTMIGETALADYPRVKSVTLPETVTAIDMRAFKNCTGLERISIPDGVSFIGGDAFENCKLLKSVTLPAGLEKLETTLFMNCIGLESVVIPAEVKSISAQVFRDCTALRKLDYLGTVNEWNAIAKDAEWNLGSAIETVHCIDGDVKITSAKPPEPEHDGSYGLEYRIDGNRAVLVGIGTCTDKNIVIASKYNGVPVTEIGDSAFLGCSGIKSVLIPESVTSIGAHAFSLCEGLESVNIPNKVTSIETYAFHACKSLKVIDIGNVTKIDDFAFTMCEGLESISFGNKLQSIGYQAFFHCSSLKELTLPESLTTIADWAFDCSSLRRVSVGKNIKKIGEAAFIMCSELSEFVYRGTRESWKSVTLGEDWKSRQISLIKCSDGDIDLNASPEYDGSQGLVYGLSKDKKSASLVGIGTCTDKNIVIASTFDGVPVISVAEGVFKDNANITGIHIPASVTALNGLFYNCQNVKSLTVDPAHPSFYSEGNCIIDKQSKTILVGCNGSVIPDDGSILRIGMSSFDGCDGITELTIPDGVLIIYDYAFDNCINLRSVKIPESLTKINSAFNGCTSLEHVELPSEMEWVGGFSGCTSLKKITLPKTGKLSSGAFRGCTALESVTVPSGTSSLYSTFEGCTSLKSVILPDTLTSISKYSFLNCTSLESITIPRSVTELNDSAFKNCSRLSAVNFAGTAEEWRSIFKDTDWNQNCNFSVVHCSDGDATAGPESDGSAGLEYIFDLRKQYAILTGIGTCTDSEITVAKTYGGVPVKSISQAFGGNFTSIVIPDSVTEIENGAFANCPELRSIHFPASVNDIPVDGLFNCKHLESLTVDPENPNYTSSGNCIIDKRTGILILGANTARIPSDGSVNEIGKKAFINRSGLTDIVIPEGVISIGEYAFANCTALKTVSLPNSLKQIDLYAFTGCFSLREIEIKAAEVIFDYAFKDCTSLESIVLPDTCEVLNGRIFENCTSLKTVKLPETLRYLDCLFVNCPSLESITLPASLTQITACPFVDCGKLTDLRFAGTVEEWNAVEKPLFWYRDCTFTVIHCSDGDAELN